MKSLAFVAAFGLLLYVSWSAHALAAAGVAASSTEGTTPATSQPSGEKTGHKHSGTGDELARLRQEHQRLKAEVASLKEELKDAKSGTSGSKSTSNKTEPKKETTATGTEKKEHHATSQPAGTGETRAERIEKLRTENAALKAQIARLKAELKKAKKQ